MIIHGNLNNFNQEILSSNSLVIIDFWAPWCVPCKMLSSLLEQSSSKFPDIKIIKINVDEFPAIASQFNIQSLPTLLFVKNGKIRNSYEGFMPANILDKRIEKAI